MLRRGCALFLCLVVGCGLTQRRQSAVPYVIPTTHEHYPPIERASTTCLAAAMCPPRDDVAPRARPLQVLVMCAGGADSAFSTGAVLGWTKAGNRPTFDVVTGTSSGALIGTFAFLGPKYDARLEAMYKDLSRTSLFRVRPVRYLLLDGAVASFEPLEERLAAEITDEFLADLRAAHAEGRRLFVGTTNVETKRLVVWDVGAIASSGRADAAVAVRKILLASMTWPGLLPPVEFEVQADGQWRREQHVDGGAATQAFVRFGPTAGWPSNGESARGWLTGSDMYVVASGRLYCQPAPPPQKLFGRIMNGVGCLTSALARADVHHLYTLCLSSGMRFHLLSLPDDYRGPNQNILQLSSEELHRLFEAGYRLTASGAAWRHTPPGVEPGEEDMPRGAVRVEAASSAP